MIKFLKFFHLVIENLFEIKNLKFEIPMRSVGLVGKCSVCNEAEGVSHRGVYRSKNVGISNRNVGEIPTHRKSKVSWAMAIIPGLVGPKARPKGVVDGHKVNIP